MELSVTMGTLIKHLMKSLCTVGVGDVLIGGVLIVVFVMFA